LIIFAVLRIRIPDPVPFWPLDPGSGMNISDHITKSLGTIFRVKKRDPESLWPWIQNPVTKNLNIDPFSLNMDRKHWFGRKIRAIDLVLHVLWVLGPNPGCQEMFSHVLSSGDNCFPPHLMNQAGDYICLYIFPPSLSHAFLPFKIYFLVLSLL
jgi:hypothetical protein